MVSPSLSSEGVRAEDETVCSGCVIQVEWIGNGVRLVAGFHVVRVEFVGILVEQWAVQRGGTVHGDVPVAVVHGDEHGVVPWRPSAAASLMDDSLIKEFRGAGNKNPEPKFRVFVWLLRLGLNQRPSD